MQSEYIFLIEKYRQPYLCSSMEYVGAFSVVYHLLEGVSGIRTLYPSLIDPPSLGRATAHLSVASTSLPFRACLIRSHSCLSRDRG